MQRLPHKVPQFPAAIAIEGNRYRVSSQLKPTRTLKCRAIALFDAGRALEIFSPAVISNRDLSLPIPPAFPFYSFPGNELFLPRNANLLGSWSSRRWTGSIRSSRRDGESGVMNEQACLWSRTLERLLIFGRSFSRLAEYKAKLSSRCSVIRSSCLEFRSWHSQRSAAMPAAAINLITFTFFDAAPVVIETGAAGTDENN